MTRDGWLVVAVALVVALGLASWWRYRSRPGIVGKRTYVGDLGFDEFVGGTEREAGDGPVAVRDGALGVDHEAERMLRRIEAPFAERLVGRDHGYTVRL